MNFIKIIFYGGRPGQNDFVINNIIDKAILFGYDHV